MNLKTSFYLIFFLQLSFSQIKGEAIYIIKQQQDVSFSTGDSGLDKKLNSNLKKAYNKKFSLKFNNNESLYEEIKKIDIGPNHVEAMSVNGIGKLHKKGLLYTNQKDIFGKIFLIKDSLKLHNWKLKKGTKEIKGYKCKKATTDIQFKDNLGNTIKESITVYYTEEIKTNQGPEFLFGLPGLIMEATFNDKNIILEKVNIKDVKIKIPISGKAVNNKTFKEIIKKRFN